MKNFLIIVLMVAIVIGTCFGVKAEIDAWNKKNNVSVTEAKDLIEEDKKEETNQELNDSELDLSEY